MLSFLSVVTFAITVATLNESNMKPEPVNYTTTEVVDLSNATMPEITANKSIDKEKIPRKCRGRAICGNSLETQIQSTLEINRGNLITASSAGGNNKKIREDTTPGNMDSRNKLTTRALWKNPSVPKFGQAFTTPSTAEGRNHSERPRTSLQPTWETHSGKPVVDHNSVRKTSHFSTIPPATPQNFTLSYQQQGSSTPTNIHYGILKYANETRRRPSGPLTNLKTQLDENVSRIVPDLFKPTKFAPSDNMTINSSDSVSKVIQQEIPWPVKKEAVVEGDLVLGGLMMVHEREDTITCGPVMPQGGIQALEAMLYTLDMLNFAPEPLLPNITLGAHILDDCDKDTYGLEMAVDFIKGYHRKRRLQRSKVDIIICKGSSISET